MIPMPARRSRPSLADRAIVLAVADAEREGAAWLDRAAQPPLPEADDDALLVARARRIAAEEGIEAPVRKALESQRLLWPAAALAGLLAGLSAAWAGLAGGGDPTSPGAADLNVLWFLQVTLGVHTLFFLGAVVAMAVALAGASHPLMGLAHAGARWLGQLLAGRGALSGVRAAAATLLGGRRGALMAGALGHTAGLGFVVGAVLALLVAASFREQYRFFWKSTLLSGGQAAALIDAVASGPRALGFPSPGAQEIAGARAGGTPIQPEAGETAAWAWMLVGALLVWGAAPRLVALAASLAAMRVVTNAAALPVSASYRRRALERQRRASVPGEPREHEGAAESVPASPSAVEDDRPLGEPAMLAYELDVDGAWPPRDVGAWTDLGMVDGAADRRRVVETLDGAATRPAALVAFFSRGETPAQAERGFLRELVARGAERTAVVLTLSRSLATDRSDRDAERIARRTALWREAAEAAGVRPERIIEADLHHLTGTTTARLKELAHSGDRAPVRAGTDAIARSLDDVQAWADRADASPASLASLLRSIEARFDAAPAWRRAARAAASLDLDDASTLVSDGARSLGRLLPAWMPRHPAWMGATATLVTTGTLSAVLLAGGPIGFAAGLWPLYAAVGAAIGELGARAAGALRPQPPGDREAIADGAQAAVLHALVLGFQGRPDEDVARSIDGVLRDAPAVHGAPDVAALIAHVRTRLAPIGGPR